MDVGSALVVVTVILAMAGAFMFVTWHVVSLYEEREARQERVWERALRAPGEAWVQMTSERKIWHSQMSEMQRWLVELAKAARPSALAEQTDHLEHLRGEVSTMLNRVQVMLGLSADPNAETQKTTPPRAGVEIVSGKGLSTCER